MIMSRRVLIGIGVGIGIGIVLAIGCTLAAYAKISRLSLRTETLEAKLEDYREFCLKTMWAIQQDADELGSPTPSVQAAAFSRFYESAIIHHNAESVYMCISSKKLNSNALSACWLQKDFACLSRLAREIGERLEKEGLRQGAVPD